MTRNIAPGWLSSAALLAATLGVFCLTGSPALAQSEEGGQGGQEQSAGSTLDLPLIGKIELPDFLSFLGSSDDDGSGGSGPGGTQQAGNQPPPAVITQTATVKPVGDRFEFIGRIAAIQQVSIQARVEGYLDTVAFKGGETVRKGDLLFQIETAQYDAALASARAQLSGAQAQLNQAGRSLARSKELAQSGTVSQSTLDDAQAAFESAQATQLQAEAAVQQAELNLGYTRIVAPIDGTISAPLITAGNYVSNGSGALANLIQMDPIWGVFPIGEGQLINWKKLGIGSSEPPPVEAQPAGGADAEASGDRTNAGGNSGGNATGDDPEQNGPEGRQAAATAADTAEPADAGSDDPQTAEAPSADGSAAAGSSGPPAGAEEVGGEGEEVASSAQEAEDFVLSLVLPNGSNYRPTGAFDFVDNTVSATTGTIETRIRFPNPEGYLLPNENVTLVTTQKAPPRLPVIPQTAVQLSREGRSVLIVKDDDTIERRMITVAADGSDGTLDPGEVAVTEGLSGGENVVVRGAATLKEGQKVSPRPASAQAGNGNAQPEAAPAGGGTPRSGEAAGGEAADSGGAAEGGSGGGGATE
ncbi:efflux RND transporter periplasmic adaptor subunit [Jiella avicenniae]|uniref:Efflux RND transporter periplasmic adaptor subunit n=1 Tax=Jiella avicenniae TaxID=2907202 RepID=A0A9X1NZG9_9HYPH|nr:efflux RND transporter periplasmic adaptor subunit [Jiella avicenniae]MCE7027545.1 efflux RND transporter periplasmic adaptor subunit [Jiella avicenniae]